MKTSTEFSVSSSAYKKRLGITPDVVELAKKSLLESAKMEEKRKPESSEVIVKEDVSLDDFLDYRKSDLRLPVRLYLRDGKIIINEIPTVIHATVSALFKVFMGRWNYRDLRYGDDTTMILNQNNVKEPDSWVRPVRRPRPPLTQAMDRLGTPYPTMIVEVGHAQSLPDLHWKVELYFDVRTTIQIVLTIKIYEPRVDHTAAMIAALYLFQSTSGLLGRQGLQMFLTYQMNIPATELFDGDPAGVPASAIGGFNLDLWEFQVVIRESFNIA
ncbi:3061_t:CDS:2 [Paraglomus brasilianum]|uniref:3061_t:CDS:1 n=1 Tax=Paraglomus brasilianum TaxID=144538 RepID=A0A9N9GDB5_9GLOM|nr:3061_t:CDS:2 [Paraglomus brasilianum]